MKKDYISILFIVFFASNSQAQTIGVFGGFGTPDNIGDIIRNKFQHKFTAKAAVLGISGQRPFVNFTPSIQLKGEVQLLQHFSIQKCQEITIAPLIRIANVFNTQQFPIHFSIGDGISGLIGAEPNLEKRKSKPKRILNYFLVDFATNIKDKEIFFRWHHRCHIFKRMAPAGTGSNFFLLGIRSSF